jgi:hypothetical protein
MDTWDSSDKKFPAESFGYKQEFQLSTVTELFHITDELHAELEVSVQARVGYCYLGDHYLYIRLEFSILLRIYILHIDYIYKHRHITYNLYFDILASLMIYSYC